MNNMLTGDGRGKSRERSVLAVLFFATITLLICGGRAAADEGNQPKQNARDLVGRSVPFIERNGAEWIASKKCLSCHQTAFMLWSLNSAKRTGIRVDEAKLNEWTQWAVDWKHLGTLPVPDADRQKTITAHNDTVAQLLLAQAARSHGADQPQWVLDFANNLGAGQQKDGSWTPGGQLPVQKRPARETQEVSTTWALLGLSAAHVKNESVSPLLIKARAWLGENTVGKSTEWWATRAMFERTFGAADKADYFRAELLKRQRPDGGWGWLCDEESDAFGTGIALFALSQCKIPATDPAITKAHQFLARTQSKDGSWPVHGTKQNKKDRIESTATFWGTCWAVIGLCSTLND